MPRLITKAEKEIKISNKIKKIQDLYDLAFEADCGNLIVAESFKLDLNMQPNQSSIISASQLLAQQVKLIDAILELYPNETDLKELKSRLRSVHTEMVKLIRTEFATIRTKIDLEKAKAKEM